jgi:hypothetical protein
VRERNTEREREQEKLSCSELANAGMANAGELQANAGELQAKAKTKTKARTTKSR